MHTPAAKLSWRILGLVLFGGFLVAFLIIAFPKRLGLLSGLVFGTIFQQTILAAAWAAVGPGPIKSRIRWSLAWVGVFAVAFGLGTQRSGPLFIIAITLAGLWLFAQIPYWLSAWLVGLKIQHYEDVSNDLLRRGQFEIRHLMMFTAAIGVLLGIGRFVVSFQWSGTRYVSDFGEFMFFLTAQVLMSIPLVFASLLPRFALPSAVLALVFIVVVTLGEVTVGNQFFGGGIDRTSIYSINASGVLWTLIFAITIRSCGYRLSIARSAA